MLVSNLNLDTLARERADHARIADTLASRYVMEHDQLDTWQREQVVADMAMHNAAKQRIDDIIADARAQGLRPAVEIANAAIAWIKTFSYAGPHASALSALYTRVYNLANLAIMTGNAAELIAELQRHERARVRVLGLAS